MSESTKNVRYYINTTIYLVLFLLFISGLFAPFTFLKDDIVSNAVIKTPVNPKVEIKQKKKDVIEKPLHKETIPNFALIKDVKEKKRQFFAYLRPAVEKQNKKIIAQRVKLEAIKARYMRSSVLTAADIKFIKQLNNTYKNNAQLNPLEQLEQLLLKVDVVPVPLVLVQAANESAWGTSRFAKVGLNFFGMWCFEKGCGMVPRGRTQGEIHEVASFNSLNEAVTAYLNNINTNAAYKELRNIRSGLREQSLPLKSEELVKGLLSYSQRGKDYVVELTKMIRQNKPYF